MAVFSIQLTGKPHQTGEPRGPLPSGGLGDESGGNARPIAECFQSASPICTPLRGSAAQKRVQGFSPA